MNDVQRWALGLGGGLSGKNRDQFNLRVFDFKFSLSCVQKDQVSPSYVLLKLHAFCKVHLLEDILLISKTLVIV